MIDTNGMDGTAIVDYDNKMISISQTFYYNMNSEGLINNAIVASREINNSRFGQTTISAEIDAVKENGFSSKVWNVNDWSVSFKCEFIGLDSDEAVSNALQSNPEANALRYDEKLGANGVWDSNTRTLTLGPNRGGLGPERGSTLNHEIGHSWGLPHENKMPNSALFGDVNNGSGQEGTGIMSYGNNRIVKQHEVEYGVDKILSNIPENHPSSVKLHIK